jgi:hypothetical protein
MKTIPTTKPASCKSQQKNYENNIINQIRSKLTGNKAMISKADKGNSIVIMYQDDYNRKIHEFISNNNLQTSDTDITKKLPREVRNTINEFQHLIPKIDRWKYVNLNPMAPTIRGLMKVHKEGTPVRPIINWKNAPAYNLAKMLVKKLHTHIPLPYTFNVEKTVQLIIDLRAIPYDRNMKFASLDLTNMYSNIPTNELMTILENICENNNVERGTACDIMKIAQVLIKQNYFQYQDTTYVQTEGLAMGAPTSSIFSEIFLQRLENT